MTTAWSPSDLPTSARAIGEAFLDKAVSMEDVAEFLDGELRRR